MDVGRPGAAGNRMERGRAVHREGRPAYRMAGGRSNTVQKGGRSMESGNMDHADAGVSRTAQTRPGRKKPSQRPDALLRYLIAHAEFDLALLFVKGQYLLYQRVGKVLRTKGVSPETLYAAFAAELGDSGWLTPDVMRCGVGPAGAFAVKFVAPGKHLLHFDAGNPSK